MNLSHCFLSAGRGPERPREFVVTPNQRRSGAAAFQFVLLSQFAPPAASYDATSAARSEATLPCAAAWLTRPGRPTGASSATHAATTPEAKGVIRLQAWSLIVWGSLDFRGASCCGLEWGTDAEKDAGMHRGPGCIPPSNGGLPAPRWPPATLDRGRL